jgi:predicted RNase H-like HicB family nuclease
MTSYIALLEHDAEHGVYGVTFPDFPGCTSVGDDLDDARRMAEEALEGHIEVMTESGEALPEPSTLAQIMADPENAGAVAVLIPAPAVESKTVRVNVTFDEKVLRRIDAYAEARGFTRSGFLARAASRVIEEDGAVA